MIPLLLSLLLPALAGDALSFEARNTVVHGQEDPAIYFIAGESGMVRASATCAGRTWHVSRNLGPGARAELLLQGFPEGSDTCAVEVEFLQANGAEGAMELSVEVASLPIVDLVSTLDDIDLAGGTAKVKASRPIHEAMVTIYGPRGVQLDQTMAEVTDGGRTLSFRFHDQGQDVIKMEVEARDEHGFASTLTLWPWSYQIPHEDLIFATGSHEITTDEEPKLRSAWAEVVHVVDLYGSVAPMKMYVAGYTDTVGDAGSNQALSDRRARSIAQWFKAQGFPGEVYYQGFGESVLAVGTPDSTDEARNRRALYIVASQEPPRSESLPRGAWKKL